MFSNTTRSGMSDTEQGQHMRQPQGPPCMPPPGFTGPPPPGATLIAAERLWKIVPPIIISVGLIGNILTLIILLRHGRKLSSTAVFLLTLTISDTLFLLNAPLRHWILAMWDEDVRHISEIGCKFSVYLTYSSLQLSSWVLVAVTVERFICVVWPHRVRLGCTPRSSVIMVIILSFVIFGGNTHILYGYGRSDLLIFRNRGFCEPLYEGYNTFWSKTYSWIDFIVVFVIPFCILLLANVTIIYKLRKTHEIRRNISIDKTGSHKTSSRDTRTVTIMLILLSVVFFICLTPVSIFYIYRPYWLESITELQCIDIYEYFRLREVYKLVEAITNLLGYINSAFNFVLYIVSGSKYRAELKALILCRPVGESGLFGGSGFTPRRRGTTSTIASVRSRSSSTSTSKSVGSHTDDVVNLNPSIERAYLSNNNECTESVRL
ncbi:lysophosphatidic acid receptor 6-like [Ruditapes philippinarum]|uniref:lysophosphatidic acid receptor 6-like n=1 Tax=Ruditapes philippinarum TaxID=129788 RepID=UPI00295B6B0E|nr:lysophosphatidic acid receptor 6-like [Ruditapes philippinarum]